MKVRALKTAGAIVVGVVLVSGVVLASGVAMAGQWKFKVVNKSQTAAVEFRTHEDGEWSSNWISDRVEPGDTFDMDFGTDKGDCTVRTQIRFTDGSYFDAAVDYCKASTLIIHEKTLIWE